MSEQPPAEIDVLTGGVEPQEVGTRIEDGKGRRWVRVHRAGGPAPWWLVDAIPDADSWAVWSAIPEPTRFTPPATRGWDGDPNHPEAVDCDGYPLSSGERCGRREHRVFSPGGPDARR